MLSDIGTTGDSNTYLSRRWYEANAPHRNHLNFREREFTPGAAPGVIRIAAVGDSFTFGMGILEQQRVSNLLDAALNAAGSQRFEVLNFGKSGANYEQHVLNLRTALKAARPHHLLLQWYPNDLDDPGDPRPRPYPLGSILHKGLVTVSVLYFLAARAFDDAQIKMGIIDVDAYYRRFLDPADPIARRANERFRRVIDVAREAQVPIAVYLWPDLTRPLGTSPNDPVIDQVLKTCLAERIECVDLRLALRSERQHGRLIVNRFDPHASAEANAMAARLLLDRLGDRWRTAAKAPTSDQTSDPVAQVTSRREFANGARVSDRDP